MSRKASLLWPRSGAPLGSGGSWSQPVEPPSRSPHLLLAWSPESINGVPAGTAAGPGARAPPLSLTTLNLILKSSTSAQEALPEASCAGLE